MRARARVESVTAGRARLACEAPASSCAACAGGRGCALRWLGRATGTTLDVPETVASRDQLVPGDAVVIEVSDGDLLRAALRAYLPPLLGLLAGAAVARLGAGAGEGVAVLAALAGLVIGWGVARAWLGRAPPRYRLVREAAP